LSGAVTRSNYITPSGELKADVTIESGGASGTLSSQVQNLNNDGEFELTKLVKSTDTVFGATGKGLGLFQQSSQQNVSVSANFSITPTGDRIKVNSSTNDVEFQGITYTAGGGERITVVFENAGTNNIIVKHGSTSVLDGYRLYLPGGEDIKVVSDYASMTFEFTNYTSVDEWQLVSYVQTNINPVTDLGTITTNQEDDWDIGEGIYFTVEPTSLISPAPDLDVTGIDGVAGRTVTIINESSNRDISFKHQDSSSLAANRFTLPGGSDFTLSADHNSATFYKPNDTIGWVLISNT